MEKRKIFGAIAVFAAGMLGALPETEAMFLVQDEPFLGQDSPRGFAIIRGRSARCGELVACPSRLTDSDVTWVGPDLAYVLIPQGVEVLGQKCCAYQQRLFQVVFEFGSQPTTVEAGAFESCSSLKSICIPASVEVIQQHCFASCGSLAFLFFEPDSQLTTMGVCALRDCCSLQTLRIPTSMEIIGNYCFSGCESLISVFFEAGPRLTIMEIGTFGHCLDLRALYLPENAQMMGNCCFVSCPSSVSVFREDGSQLDLVEGGRGASTFSYVYLPDRVAFGTCISEGVFVEEMQRGDVRVVDPCQGTYTDPNILQSLRIPRHLREIRDFCFDRCVSLQEISFEEGSQLTVMGIRAFSRSALRSILVPASVRVIEQFCFSGCASLASVSFEAPSQLSSVREGAFRGTIISHFHFPETVVCEARALRSSRVREVLIGGVPADPFSGICSGTDVSLDLVVRRDIDTIIDSCFEDCSALASIVFEAGSRLMRIGAHAFAGSSLSSITIPASVEHLEKGCFKYCSGLVSVTFEGGSRLQSLGEWAFAYSQLSSILLPAGVEVIPQCCFANCLSLTSVSFGASSQLTTIEERAFGGCRVLRVVGIPKDTWVMGSVDFTIYRLPPATVTSMMDS